ncbi:hypothetical protein P4706_14425 [Peribacillus castrilensis]|uniref:Uncharacterized protein n=1 Tax=Peribacillus castrilensis TaxID=2897690 RepID=A0AAW9NG05_9BACI|nr:hypothetical protein [Peribacillus castrilensis]
MVPLIFVKICDVSSSLSMTVKAVLFYVLPMSAALAVMKRASSVTPIFLVSLALWAILSQVCGAISVLTHQ